jgi:hypothetical protein
LVGAVSVTLLPQAVLIVLVCGFTGALYALTFFLPEYSDERMTDDSLKPIRDHLVVACNLLAGNSARTDALSDRLRAVERQMDWRGDPQAALYALPAIIGDLGGLNGTTPGATLPGVAEAIAQLESAVTLLKAAV